MVAGLQDQLTSPWALLKLSSWEVNSIRRDSCSDYDVRLSDSALVVYLALHRGGAVLTMALCSEAHYVVEISAVR